MPDVFNSSFAAGPGFPLPAGDGRRGRLADGVPGGEIGAGFLGDMLSSLRVVFDTPVGGEEYFTIGSIDIVFDSMAPIRSVAERHP